MRVVHWSLNNISGLNRVALSLATIERACGIESCVAFSGPASNEPPIMSAPGSEIVSGKNALTADIHVIHSHCPDKASGRKVFVAHGTPEHCFEMALTQFAHNGYVAGDPWMVTLWRVDASDITVTFWPRHAYIWQSMNKRADIRTLPLGVDRSFWVRQERPRWTGNPSVFMAENCHKCKWPLDIILSWPLVMTQTEAVLHLHYLPADEHRFWYPLMHQNHTVVKSYSSGAYFSPPDLLDAFSSSVFYLNPVRYGDFNTVGIEAKASGCKLISYQGNPYADYWLTEGDQRTMAAEMVKIFTGETEARHGIEVPDITSTAYQMMKIYQELTGGKLDLEAIAQIPGIQAA